MELIYVAMPYSHPDKAVIRERMAHFYKICADLLNNGLMPISPVLNHPICEQHEVPGDYEFWGNYSRVLLGRCNKVIVIKFPGWEESVGVKDEIRHAYFFGLPIAYLDV